MPKIGKKVNVNNTNGKVISIDPLKGKYCIINDDKEIIESYFSHHQGMILASLCNYLKDNAIRDYFHKDVRVKAIEILLK